METKVYKTPKEVCAELGIHPSTLKKYRLSGHLTDLKWSVNGGKPYYNIAEVKKLFHK